MNKIHDYFKKHNIDEKDIPQAFILYKSLGVMIGITCFSMCYKFRPIQTYMHRYPLNILTNNFKNTFPNFYTRAGNFIDEKTYKISNSRFIRPIPEFFKLEPQRTTIAIGETVIIRDIFTPITVPLKFWFTVHWMQNHHNKNNNNITIQKYARDTFDVICSKKSIISNFSNK